MKNCVAPYQTFADTKAWLSHMKAEHKRNIVRWTCSVGKHESPVEFNTQSGFEDHVRQDHPRLAYKSQIAIITKRSGGPSAEMFKECPLCTWFPESDVGPKDVASNTDVKDTMKIDARHARDANRIKIHQHIAEHLQSISLTALPDVLFDSSRRCIGSASSVSSSSDDSRESDLSIGETEIESILEQEIDPIDEQPIKETEDEQWLWVYQGLLLDPRPGRLHKPVPPCEIGHLLGVYTFARYITLILDLVTCPYHENRLFVDRPKLFRRLIDMVDHSGSEDSSRSASTIVIHGPPGAG